MIASSGDLLARLPLAQACVVLEVARCGCYRLPAQSPALEPLAVEEAPLLAAIEATVLEFPGYGYPRVTAHLRREGWKVNHKRVYRLMREAELLQGRRRGQVRTTDSEHGFPIYPNLLRDCGWRSLTRPDAARGADLTYVRLGDGYCYLAVLLDRFSRRIVGWNLAQSLEAQGALAALEMALHGRQPAGGWIQHSDRGVRVPACG